MKTFKLFFLFMFLSTFISCEEDSSTEVTDDCFTMNNLSKTPSLESNWTFIGLINNLTGEKICTPENYSNVVLSLDPFNSCTIDGSCNTISVHYVTQPDDVLVLDKIPESVHTCTNDTISSWEKELFYNIGFTYKYSIEGDLLSLHTDGSYDLKFRFLNELPTSSATCLDFENNYFDVSLARKWIFLGYIKNDEIFCKPDNIQEMFIEFSDTNTIEAQSAVNEIVADYEIYNSDSVQFKNYRKSLVFNVDKDLMEWDRVFLSVEKGYRYYNYNIAGIKLSLTANNGHKYIFRAADYQN